MKDALGHDSVASDANVSKISVVGVGMRSRPGVAKTCSRPWPTKAQHQVISTSEIQVSV